MSKSNKLVITKRSQLVDILQFYHNNLIQNNIMNMSQNQQSIIKEGLKTYATEFVNVHFKDKLQ